MFDPAVCRYLEAGTVWYHVCSCRNQRAATDGWRCNSRPSPWAEAVSCSAMHLLHGPTCSLRGPMTLTCVPRPSNEQQGHASSLGRLTVGLACTLEGSLRWRPDGSASLIGPWQEGCMTFGKLLGWLSHSMTAGQHLQPLWNNFLPSSPVWSVWS